MSVDTLHVLHAIYKSGLSITQLSDGVANQTFNELIGMSAGHHYPLFTGILENKPEITFRSPQLRTLLTAFGISGLDISGANTDLEWRKAVDLGARTAISGANIRTRLTQGLIYPRTITAQQGQVAEMDGRISVTWDGSNNPFVPAGAAITATPQAAEQFTLGPCKINGTWVAGVKEVTIDTGAQLFEELADGDLYPTFAGIMEHNPISVTIRTHVATNWTTYGVTTGTALTAFLGYLRRIQADLGPYGTGSSQHIKFAGDYGIVLGTSGRGGGNQPVSTELRILFRQDDYSAAAPLVPTLDSTIV
jgi:hypothetical protein